MTQDYGKALQDLNDGKNPVDDVQAAAQAADQAIQGLEQDIETHWQRAIRAQSPLQRHAAMQQVRSDLQLLLNVMQTEDAFQEKLAQEALQLAQKYQQAAPGNSGQTNQTGGNQTGGNQTGGNQTGGNQTGGRYSRQTGGNQTGGRYSGQNGGTFPGQNGGTFPGQTSGMCSGQNGGMFPGQNGGRYSGQNGGMFPGQNGGMFPGQNGGMFPGQNGSMFPGQNGGVSPASMSGGGQDPISSLMSMLPMLMMPLMLLPLMIPSMLSGAGSGARQPSPGPAQGAQAAGYALPDAGHPPADNNAPKTGDTGDGRHTKLAANSPTEPSSSVQSVGNSVPAGPNTDVKLPDGTTTHAPNAQAAAAARAVLNGATPADAYQQVGVNLPPPGTPVINPIAPGDLQAGDIGVWKDHIVMALGGGKVLVDGQVQPVSSVGSSPDFLGWMRPTQQSSGQPAVSVSEPTPASPPAPSSGAGAPVQAAVGAP